ncbi:MAG: MBL fold metallo-hydrolase [Bacillota bacterium]|nr:MBL fold metallo-hydrolase [Bacillota bacterium]
MTEHINPEHIKGNTYMTRLGHTDVGLYIKGNEAVLIDTGSEEVPELIRWFEDHDIKPKAIINTHLHIDHIGCNQLLCERYACRVFASGDEIRHENDAGYTDSSGVCVNDDNGPLHIDEDAFEIISLRGHSEGHQAVVSPDGVCFLGDAVMSIDKLNKTKMPYHYDLKDSLASMEKLQKLATARPDFVYVISHFGVYDRDGIIAVSEANQQKELALMEAAASLMDELSQKHLRHMRRDKLASLFMDRIGISREKQDIYWVQETARERVGYVCGETII